MNKYDGSVPTKTRILDGLTICPSCRLNTAQLVADDCVVCNGHGTIRLGLAALSIYDVDVVSLAVGLTYDQADNLEQAFNDLDTAGVTRRQRKPQPEPEPVKPPRPKPAPATEYAKACQQLAMELCPTLSRLRPRRADRSSSTGGGVAEKNLVGNHVANFEPLTGRHWAGCDSP